MYLENADAETCKNALQLSGLRGYKKHSMTAIKVEEEFSALTHMTNF